MRFYATNNAFFCTTLLCSECDKRCVNVNNSSLVY